MKQTKVLRFGKPIILLTSLLQRKPWQGIFRQRPALLPIAAAILVIFGLVFGSFGTVYAAQDSLPNEILYSVKLTGEKLLLAFTADTEARIALLTSMAGNRMDEATALVEQGEAIPESVPYLLDEHLEELFTLTASLDDDAIEEAIKGIQIHLRDQDQDMTNAMRGLPEGLDPQLEQLREMAKERQKLVVKGEQLEDFEPLQRQLRNQSNKPVITETLTTTLTTTVTMTSEITATKEITPGLYVYGPGPCEDPGECEPFGDQYGPGPFEGDSPVPDDHEGYGPGDDQGPGPQQPPETPKPDDVEAPKGTPDPDGDDGGSKDQGDDSSSSKKGKP